MSNTNDYSLTLTREFIDDVLSKWEMPLNQFQFIELGAVSPSVNTYQNIVVTATPRAYELLKQKYKEYYRNNAQFPGDAQ